MIIHTNRHAIPAFSATALQHVTAAFRHHALPETMHTNTAANFGLVSSLDHNTISPKKTRAYCPVINVVLIVISLVYIETSSLTRHREVKPAFTHRNATEDYT